MSAQRKELIKDWQNSAFQHWAGKYCRTNYWRVQRYLGDFDDCMAECACIYWECRLRYGATVNSNAHFMALYKLMVKSYFTDYSNYDTRYRDTLSLEGVIPSLVPGVELDKLLVHRTKNSSNEVKQVVNILLNGPVEVLETIGSDLVLAKNYLKRVLRLAGIDNNKRDQVQQELRSALEFKKVGSK